MTAKERNIPIIRIGVAANRSLYAGMPWQVIAVFKNSFYCQNRRKNLICIGPSAMGAGPLNANYECSETPNWEAEGLSPGDTAKQDGKTRFCIKGSFVGCFVISFAGANVWRPVVEEKPMTRWTPWVLKHALEKVRREAQMRVVSDGFGPLVIPMAGNSLLSLEESFPPTPLMRLAVQGINPLIRWLMEAMGDTGSTKGSRVSKMPDDAKVLIGLGPGLTPSGDDFLGGLLVTLRRLRYQKAADTLAEWVLSHAPERTNIISYAHLENAAKGDCGEALHKTLEAISDGKTEALSHGITALDDVGHSSGWDALAGVTLALRTAFETKS